MGVYMDVEHICCNVAMDPLDVILPVTSSWLHSNYLRYLRYYYQLDRLAKLLTRRPTRST